MKTPTLKFSQLLQALRYWLTPQITLETSSATTPGIHSKTTPRTHILLSTPPLTQQAELLQLCCKLFGKNETAVRREIRHLAIQEIDTIHENSFPYRNFKGLRIECEEHALWLDFSPLPNKNNQENHWLYCYDLWLFYSGEKNKQEFTKALDNPEHYSPLWENCYLDLETNKIKITHTEDCSHEQPIYCLYLSMLNIK